MSNAEQMILMSPDPKPIFRFAPSPNGYLHLGHAYSAILCHDLARSAGGQFLLRMEDIDITRCKPEFETAILEDMDWLQLIHDGPVLRQSDRFDAYRDDLTRLTEQGLVYPASMTRGEIRDFVARFEAAGQTWPRDPDGAPHYPGQERQQPGEGSDGAAVAFRLDTDRATDNVGQLNWRETGAGPDGQSGVIEADPTIWGDAVLARKDVPTSYHLAVVADDAAQGITHVVRGIDLFWSTSFHRLLQELLGLPTPVYNHHRLVLDEAGRKLSKSDQDTGLRELRAAGWTAPDVRRHLGL